MAGDVVVGELLTAFPALTIEIDKYDVMSIAAVHPALISGASVDFKLTLLGIPPEIRDKIIGQLLVKLAPNNIVALDTRTAYPYSLSHHSFPVGRSGQVLRVCRTIYNESINYLYDTTIFITKWTQYSGFGYSGASSFLGRIQRLSLTSSQLHPGANNLEQFTSLKMLTIRELIAADRNDIDIASQTIASVVFLDEPKFARSSEISRLPDVVTIVHAKPELEIVVIVRTTEVFHDAEEEVEYQFPIQCLMRHFEGRHVRITSAQEVVDARWIEELRKQRQEVRRQEWLRKQATEDRAAFNKLRQLKLENMRSTEKAQRERLDDQIARSTQYHSFRYASNSPSEPPTEEERRERKRMDRKAREKAMKKLKDKKEGKSK